MCGRFFIPEMDDTPEELAELLLQLEMRLRAADADFRLKHGEICPGDTAAVIAPSRSRHPRVYLMQWGYHWNHQLVFNARSETAFTRPMFSDSMRQRRCLIPATAYFEWNKHVPGKPKYRFFPLEHKLFYMAGIYRFEEGQKHPVFTVLTRAASDAVSSIHDRMPVILPHDNALAWLDENVSPEQLLLTAVDEVALSPA